jgi:hypothetical protein
MGALLIHLLSTDMAFAAHDRALPLLHVTFPASLMVNAGQIEEAAALLVHMTGRTLLVLGGLVRHLLNAVIDMMADVALLDAGRLVVRVMVEGHPRSHPLHIGPVGHGGNLVLAVGANARKEYREHYKRKRYPKKPFMHRISPQKVSPMPGHGVRGQ